MHLSARDRPISNLYKITEEMSTKKCMAGVEGLEPPTFGFGDRRSSQLSYTPTTRLF